MIEPDQAPDSLYSLARDLQWLGIQTCVCRFAYKSLGRVHDVSMGKGWVRMDTKPDCEHHGTEARRRWNEAHGLKGRKK